jgi:hypothetical protein
MAKRTKAGYMNFSHMKNVLIFNASMNKLVRYSLDGSKMNERFIAVCYLDERDLGATIIANKLALDCPRYSGGQFAEY